MKRRTAERTPDRIEQDTRTRLEHVLRAFRSRSRQQSSPQVRSTLRVVLGVTPASVRKWSRAPS